MTPSSEVTSLTEALIEANDQLIGLYDLADVTSQSLDEEGLVLEILDRAARMVHAEVLILTTPDRRVRFDRDDIQRSASLRSTTVTATHTSGLSGELNARRPDDDFSTGDRKLLAAVLRTTLTAIETARLHERALASALDEQERRRAAEVAQLALPSGRPTLDRGDLFFRTDQARLTGGDLFCYHIAGDDLMFAVGDVSGKGLPAAVMMTTAVCAMRAAFRDVRATAPGEQLALVSEWMYEHLDDAGVFISMFIGHHRPRDRELSWVNAGHSPCLVSTAAGVHHFSPTTPPVGVLPILDVPTSSTTLGDDDVVFVGSDGLIEQENPEGEPFGDNRLHDLIGGHQQQSVAEIGVGIMRSVTAFAGDAPQSDDRTVVLLRPRSVA